VKEEKSMGKLRNQMESNLKLRRYSKRTWQEYVRCMLQFTKFFMRSPDQLGEPEIRSYLIHLVEERKVSASLQKMYIAAIKFFYSTTLNRPDIVQHIRYPRVPKALPDILGPKEVLALFDAIRSIKHRAVIAVAYACGLRISEACGLHCRGDIDSERIAHPRPGR
jgi:integrase/recombinase XerD